MAVLEVESADASGGRRQQLLRAPELPRVRARLPRPDGARGPGRGAVRVARDDVRRQRRRSAGSRRTPGATTCTCPCSGPRPAGVCGRPAGRRRSGSVSVYATDAPYYLDYSAPGQQQLIVQVSRSSLGTAARPAGRGPTPARRARLGGGADAVRVRAPVRCRRRAAGAARPRASGWPTSPASPGTAGRRHAPVLLRDGARAAPDAGRLRPRSSTSCENAANRTLDVDGIARRRYVSRASALRPVRGAGHHTGEHLRAVRLRGRRSGWRTRPTKRPSPTIGYACGFDDATTFTRAFRRVFGSRHGTSSGLQRLNCSATVQVRIVFPHFRLWEVSLL